VVAGGNAVDEDGNPITDPSGAPIVAEDDSDSGANPNDGNDGAPGDMGTTDDPTPLLIPDVGLAKEAGAAVPNGDNFDVTFTFVYENTGTVTLDNLTLVDDIMTEFGNAFVATSAPTIGGLVGTGTLPTANGAFAGDTTQSLIVGGSLDVGSSFEVTITVTIDPDGIDSVSQGLNNQATAGGDGVNPDGTPLTDANGNPVFGTDDSDNGTDPTGENGEDNTDGVAGNDPTPILIADIGLAKSVVGQPTLLTNGDYSVTYQLVVENTGTVDLANLSLTEDLASQLAGGFVNAGGLVITVPPAGIGSTITLDSAFDGSSATELVDTASPSLLAIGDSFTLEFDVQVDASALPLGANNTVTANSDGVDENGDPIVDSNGNPLMASDDSDSGTDPSGSNNGQPGDSFGSDDPTPLQIPSVGLAKSAGDAVANGDNFEVEFTLVYENNGTVFLNNLTLLDDIAAQFGSQFVSVGNVAVQNFVDAGSGIGFAPTVNAAWAGDTSQTIIAGGAADVGDSFEVVFTVTIDPDAAGAAEPLNNQAVAGGDALDENGDPLTDADGNQLTASDVSDNGTDPGNENGVEETGDGTFANDPTPIVIADLGLAKSIVGEPVLTDAGNYVVSFQLVVENTGTVDLASLSLLEDLQTQFGAAFVDAGNLTITSAPNDVASSVTVNSAAWNGSSSTELIDTASSSLLVVGDSFTIQFDVEIDPTAVSAPLENQVDGSGAAVDSNGDPLTDSSGAPIVAADESDSGASPSSDNAGSPDDQGTSDDPTLFDPPEVPLGEISGTVFQDDNGDGIQNPGEVGLAGVEITLTGTDVYGNPVEVTVLTDASGNYTFDGLVAGEYSVSQAQPEGFEDGIVSGSPGSTVGTNLVSNISLGFGEAAEPSTFAEVPIVDEFFGELPGNGASGNPPRLPGFLPPNFTQVGGLISGFLGSPGPIYSGVPINANANVLSLDSGRAVTGGYNIDYGVGDAGEGCCECESDCDCATPVDPCSECIMEVPVEQYIDECNTCEPCAEAPVEEVMCEEGCPEVVDECNACEVVDEAAPNGILPSVGESTRAPSFLQRLNNWMHR